MSSLSMSLKSESNGDQGTSLEEKHQKSTIVCRTSNPIASKQQRSHLWRRLSQQKTFMLGVSKSDSGASPVTSRLHSLSQELLPVCLPASPGWDFLCGPLSSSAPATQALLLYNRPAQMPSPYQACPDGSFPLSQRLWQYQLGAQCAWLKQKPAFINRAHGIHSTSEGKMLQSDLSHVDIWNEIKNAAR